VCALQVERNGDECDALVRDLWARPDVGPARTAVAVDGERVLASLTVLPEHLRVCGVDVAAAQIEFVASVEDHSHRGLVRSLMELAHGWCASEGRLVQLIAGIPYFYRRFGYEYAIPFAPIRAVRDDVPSPDGVTVRPAVAGDAAAVAALQPPPADVTGMRDEAWFRRALASGWLVAERDGAVVGSARFGPGPPGVTGVALLSAVAGEAAAVTALLVHAGPTGGVEERPPVTDVVLPLTERLDRAYAMYVRVADPVAFVEGLRPVLTDRLRASPYADHTADFTVTSYASSIVLRIAGGEVVSVASGGPEQQVPPKDGIGVPPDQLVTLLFGRHGVKGLSDRHDDVLLGSSAELADVLFPRLTSDVTLL